MRDKTSSRVKAIMEQARNQGKSSARNTGTRSSLHEVIRTREQADTFMHLLRSKKER